MSWSLAATGSALEAREDLLKQFTMAKQYANKPSLHQMGACFLVLNTALEEAVGEITVSVSSVGHINDDGTGNFNLACYIVPVASVAPLVEEEAGDLEGDPPPA